MHALREFNFLFESHDSLARKLIRLRVTPGEPMTVDGAAR